MSGILIRGEAPGRPCEDAGTETGVMLPQAKECQGLLATARS